MISPAQRAERKAPAEARRERAQMHATDEHEVGNAAMGARSAGEDGGRYWIRTSDPADVNRVL